MLLRSEAPITNGFRRSCHSAKASHGWRHWTDNSLFLVLLRQLWQGLPFLSQMSYMHHRLLCRKSSFLLEWAINRRTFAVANKLQRRVKAAAQQSSNKFASAFALHFTCNVKQRKRRLDKRSLTYWNNGHTRKAEEEKTTDGAGGIIIVYHGEHTFYQ